MSVHSYSRCWLHLIWATRNRERMLFGRIWKSGEAVNGLRWLEEETVETVEDTSSPVQPLDESRG